MVIKDWYLLYTLFLRLQFHRDVTEELNTGHAKIVPNRGKYSRRALAKIHSTYCDHSVLFISGMFSLLNLRQMCIAYIAKFCCTYPPHVVMHVSLRSMVLSTLINRLRCLMLI